MNAVLKFDGAQAIEDVNYLPQILPSEYPYANPGYQFTVDAKCRTKIGRYFSIEMRKDFRSDYHLHARIEHSHVTC